MSTAWVKNNIQRHEWKRSLAAFRSNGQFMFCSSFSVKTANRSLLVLWPSAEQLLERKNPVFVPQASRPSFFTLFESVALGGTLYSKSHSVRPT